MSVKLMTIVWEELLELDSTHTLVLLAVADNANDEGACWPSIATLARKTRLHERTVQRALKTLEDAGHLSRFDKPGGSSDFWVHPRRTATPGVAPPPAHSKSLDHKNDGYNRELYLPDHDDGIIQ